MSYSKVTPLPVAVEAYKVPPANDFGDEQFAELRQRAGAQHGVIVNRGYTEITSEVVLVFIGENGKHAVKTGGTAVFVRDSEVETYPDDEALGQRYTTADSDSIDGDAPETSE